MSEKITIDAENAILGRLASYVVKQALLGKEIEIINCEKIVISGNKKNIEETYLKRRARRSDKQAGPNYPSSPERALKRTVRGMLPYKKQRGKEALKRIKCYLGERKVEGKVIKAGREKQGKYVKINKIVKK